VEVVNLSAAEKENQRLKEETDELAAQNQALLSQIARFQAVERERVAAKEARKAEEERRARQNLSKQRERERLAASKLKPKRRRHKTSSSVRSAGSVSSLNEAVGDVHLGGSSESEGSAMDLDPPEEAARQARVRHDSIKSTMRKHLSDVEEASFGEEVGSAEEEEGSNPEPEDDDDEGQGSNPEPRPDGEDQPQGSPRGSDHSGEYEVAPEL
jgi:hypothetical protein